MHEFYEDMRRLTEGLWCTEGHFANLLNSSGNEIPIDDDRKDVPHVPTDAHTYLRVDQPTAASVPVYICMCM